MRSFWWNLSNAFSLYLKFRFLPLLCTVVLDPLKAVPLLWTSPSWTLWQEISFYSSNTPGPFLAWGLWVNSSVLFPRSSQASLLLLIQPWRSGSSLKGLALDPSSKVFTWSLCSPSPWGNPQPGTCLPCGVHESVHVHLCLSTCVLSN